MRMNKSRLLLFILSVFLSCLAAQAALAAQEKNLYVYRTAYTSGGEFIRPSAVFARASFSPASRHPGKFSRPSANFNKPFLGIRRGLFLRKGGFLRPSFYIQSARKEFSRPSFYLSRRKTGFAKPSFVIAPEEGEFIEPSFKIVEQGKKYRLPKRQGRGYED